jgi:type II secretory pathway predicted ATPase ExeA
MAIHQLFWLWIHQLSWTLSEELKDAILAGKLIAFCGVIGCGKTTTLRRVQKDLRKEKKILISKSLAVTKGRVTLPTLIQALYFDLSPGKKVTIPGQPEKRERKLVELVHKRNRPVALFIDDAHELHGNTLRSLKKLIELIQGGGNTLSLVLIGHPKLKTDLRKATSEEIGARTTVFSFEGIKGREKQYIEWLLGKCLPSKIGVDTIIEDDAVDLMAEKLTTPLQIEHYLSLAFEEAYQLGQKPVTPEIIENVLAHDLNGMEPNLARQGYDKKSLADQLGIRPKEVTAFLRGQLSPERAQEITNEMLAAGIPL